MQHYYKLYLLILFCCPLMLSSFGQLPYDDDVCPEKLPKQLKKDAQKKKVVEGMNKSLIYLSYLNYSDRNRDRPLDGPDGYAQYAGKKIRDLVVQVLDPYGVSIESPEAGHLSKLQKFANGIQTKTKQWVVRNDLLFKSGDAVIPILFADTERNLWDLGTFKDIKIFMIPVEDSPDLIDVVVMVQDKWSWGIQSSVQYNKIQAGIALKNFMGLPQTLWLSAAFNFRKDDFYTLSGGYGLRNIKRTHIDASVSGTYDNLNEGAQINVSRDFFSANTRWAGHIQGGLDHQNAWLPNALGAAIPQNVTYDNQDLWLAGSFKLPQGLGDQFNLTRLVVSARMSRNQYLDRPFMVSPDGSQIFINQTYALVGIGLANWDYYVDHSVYYIDQAEYLSKGFNASMIMGYDYDEQEQERFYSGFKMNYSKYIKRAGYFDTRAAISGYVNRDGFEQGLLKFTENMYSAPLKLGRKFMVRQFLSSNINLGLDRPADHEIVMNSYNGLRGIFVNYVHGARSYVFNLETAIYPNFKVLGFSSCVFIFADFSVMQQNQLNSFQFNQGYGAGIRLRNLATGLDYFEISFAYYPKLDIPGLKSYSIMGSYGNIHSPSPDNLFSAGALSME